MVTSITDMKGGDSAAKGSPFTGLCLWRQQANAAAVSCSAPTVCQRFYMNNVSKEKVLWIEMQQFLLVMTCILVQWMCQNQPIYVDCVSG